MSSVITYRCMIFSIDLINSSRINYKKISNITITKIKNTNFLISYLKKKYSNGSIARRPKQPAG